MAELHEGLPRWQAGEMTEFEQRMAREIGAGYVMVLPYSADGGEVGVIARWIREDGSPIMKAVRIMDYDKEGSAAAVEFLKQWWVDNQADFEAVEKLTREANHAAR